MSKNLGLIETADFDDIANAIREKNGETISYFPNEMADAIRRIPTGSGSDVEIVENPLGGFDIIVDGQIYTVAKQEDFAESVVIWQELE